MNEKTPIAPKIEADPMKFPEGHLFPDETLRRWIEIPLDEKLVVGPIAKGALDQLLFSTSDMAKAIMALRGGLILYSQGHLAEADVSLNNCLNALTDAETRNRVLYDAIMTSALEVRDAAKR